ncbi:VOC family protein [Fodinicola acaciae]|uniref:VOC family protein n=1 Tax=Fodinicola acaciae TaxID=2681555 RepID=UPI0013D30DAD|nr:VOC family protein [Fodinicola acaciae]
MTDDFRPAGWHCVTPRIVASQPDALVDFVRAVFDADGTYDAGRPTELRIGDSRLLISGTGEREPMAAFLYVYVPDTDATFRRAMANGAESIEDPAAQPYGDRRAMIRDPHGNLWQIATHGQPS